MATDTPTATLVHRTLRNRARRALLALAADAAAVEAHREHPTAASRAGLPSPTQLERLRGDARRACDNCRNAVLDADIAATTTAAYQALTSNVEPTAATLRRYAATLAGDAS